MKNALRFRKNLLEPQEGEVARLKVVQGPDYGSVYVLRGSPVSIGRGEDCDVMLTDLKTSRKHATVHLTGNHWTVKDLGSANGIKVNGEHSAGSPIYTGDSVGLGETILEFFTRESDTRLIVAAPRTVTELQSSQQLLLDRKNEIRAIGKVKGPTRASAAARVQTGPAPATDASPVEKIKFWVQNNKKIAIAGAIGLVVLMMMGDDPPKKKVAKKKPEAERDLANFLPSDDPVIEKQADVFFRAGWREYREMNYLRAKSEFETVLQMAPGHKMARLYLDKSTKSIEELVQNHLGKGKKNQSSGKLKAAKGNYEAVMRLLYRDQTNSAYVEAKDQLEKVIREIKGEKEPARAPAATDKGGSN